MRLTRRRRKGVAAAEFAVVLPIFVTLFIGVNETCTALYLKEQVTIAAYEGARVGIQRKSTNAFAVDRVKDFLDERGVTYDAQKVVVISSPGFDTAQTMEHVTTTVTVPLKGNSLTGGFFTDQELSASVTMRKEYQN